MNYITGNLWDFRSAMTPVCVTTNGMTKNNGELVMGKGIALQAKQRFPDLAGSLGQAVRMYGNLVFYFPSCHVISFPTKHDWRNPSDIQLIRTSAAQLVELINIYSFERVYLTQPGCGNGGLGWNLVSAVLTPILDDRFWIVTP